MPLFAVPGLVWHAGYLVAACGNELSDPGIEPAPPALKGKVLTTGQQGKFRKGESLKETFYTRYCTKSDALCQSHWEQC